MIVRHRHGETVLWFRKTGDGTDIYGNPVPAFAEAVERPGCAVAPKVEEIGDDTNRRMVVVGYDVYDTFDTPIGPLDELEVRGVRCRVTSEVARWRNPFTGKAPGAVVSCKFVEG